MTTHEDDDNILFIFMAYGRREDALELVSLSLKRTISS